MNRIVRGGLAVLTGATLLWGGGPGAAADAPTAATAAPTPTGCSYLPRTTSASRGHSYLPRIALTFDDGPSAATSAILDILERKGVPGTFFIVGSHVRGREALLRQMLADGDMIGNHSFSHANLSTRTPAGLAQELDRTQRAIDRATGFTPCLVRPPYGITSPDVLAALGRRRLTSVLWTVNSADYTRPGVPVLERNVLAGASPGVIVLAHDGGGPRRNELLRSLPTIIDTLVKRGYKLVTVTDLLGLATTPAATAAPVTQDAQGEQP